MCGPENTNRPRGGALVALNPPINSMTSNLRGDLSFHTPGSPGSTSATHARLTPTEEFDARNLANIYVVIHSTGDMTRSVDECGLFRHFTFYDTPSTHPNDFVEFPLDKPLSLEVGNDGIIGRRVSLFSQPSSGVSKVVAEGIVGFNFISQATSPEPSSPVPSL